jgi:hypothetical protein
MLIFAELEKNAIFPFNKLNIQTGAAHAHISHSIRSTHHP